MNGYVTPYVELPRSQRTAWIVAAAGTIACVLGAIFNWDQFVRSYLWAWWFWTGIAIGSLQVLMMYQLVGGAWGYVTQRIFEAAARTLAPMFVLMIPLIPGIWKLYSYADPQKVARDGGLAHKAPYLNAPFILIRLGIYIAIFLVIAWLMTRWSDEQDRTEDYKFLRLRAAISGPGIILCSLAVTFFTVDWFMALEPDFHSTMYPGFHLVGQVLTAFALSIIVLRYLERREPMAGIISPEDYHDLGNLLLTFVVLWAYVQLAQLIIMFSGNLPKEVSWYLHRTRGEWAWIALFLAVFHFFFPFFALLSRRSKLQSRRLAFLAALVLIVHLVDNYWNVEPAFHPTGIFFSWLDAAAPVAVGGIWVALLLRQLAARPVLPAHDPRIEEALEKA